MLPSLKVLSIFIGTLINESRRLFFPKCNIKIHATENNITFSFQFLKFVSLSMRIKLMFAKAEVKTE